MGRAILYNESLCNAALDANKPDFHYAKCGLDTTGWADSVGLPRAALAPGVTAACIAVTAPADYDAFVKSMESDDPDQGGPRVPGPR